MLRELVTLAIHLDEMGLKEEADVIDNFLKEFLLEDSLNKPSDSLQKDSSYNSPRDGKKRWSVKYKKKIDCSNPRGFSQKQYCHRKMKGGAYKSK